MSRREEPRREDQDQRLEEYFMKYHTMVIRNVYQRMKDYYAAEDICQETFIRLAGHLDEVPPEKVKAWLICVSDNLALDILRKHKSKEAALERMQEEVRRKQGTEPDKVMERLEEFRETGMALKELKEIRPNWYEVIRMSCLEDMDTRAIGKALGVRPMLVSKWKERGRRWLRDAYRKQDEYG